MNNPVAAVGQTAGLVSSSMAGSQLGAAGATTGLLANTGVISPSTASVLGTGINLASLIGNLAVGNYFGAAGSALGVGSSTGALPSTLASAGNLILSALTGSVPGIALNSVMFGKNLYNDFLSPTVSASSVGVAPAQLSSLTGNALSPLDSSDALTMTAGTDGSGPSLELSPETQAALNPNVPSVSTTLQNALTSNTQAAQEAATNAQYGSTPITGIAGAGDIGFAGGESTSYAEAGSLYNYDPYSTQQGVGPPIAAVAPGGEVYGQGVLDLDPSSLSLLQAAYSDGYLSTPAGQQLAALYNV